MKRVKEDTEVKQVPVEEINLEPNPKRHSDDDVREMADAIIRYGWTQPLVLQESTMTLIVGHKRLMAARMLGLSKVPCILKNLTDLEAKAYKIADNELSQRGVYDEDILSDMVADLSEELERDEVASMTFLEKKLDDLLGDVEIKPVKLDPPPPTMAWVLIGVPVTNFAKIDPMVQAIGREIGEEGILETTVNAG